MSKSTFGTRLGPKFFPLLKFFQDRFGPFPRIQRNFFGPKMGPAPPSTRPKPKKRLLRKKFFLTQNAFFRFRGKKFCDFAKFWFEVVRHTVSYHEQSFKMGCMGFGVQKQRFSLISVFFLSKNFLSPSLEKKIFHFFCQTPPCSGKCNAPRLSPRCGGDSNPFR